MTRAALLLPSLLLAACTVGELPAPGGGSGSNSNGCMNQLAANLLQDAHMHATGGDNHDMDCTNSSCHGSTTSGAPLFRFGGTIYQKDGTTVAQGAAVLFTQTGMDPIPFYTDKGGNFYVPMDDTTLPAAFNGTVAATTCPDIRKMTAPVSTQSCSLSGSCHGPNGSGGKMTVGI